MPAGRLNWWESLFFVALIALAAFVLVRSSLFQVAEIQVAGTRLLTADEVIEASGITTGTNIFQLQLGEAEAQIRELPGIKEISLERHFPSTVEINIVERTPVALVKSGNEFWCVDEEGVRLRRQNLSEAGLPLVSTSKDDLSLLRHGLKTVLALPSETIPELSEVYVAANRRVTCYTQDGFEVRLGDARAPGEQGILLNEILKEVREGGRTVSYIDLSRPERAVVMYANP